MMRIFLSGHAVQRMFERGITMDDIHSVLEDGEVIEEYPDDFPLPSQLILGFVAGVAIHVVAAFDYSNQLCHIVTVYYPDPRIWEADFRKRRPL